MRQRQDGGKGVLASWADGNHLWRLLPSTTVRAMLAETTPSAPISATPCPLCEGSTRTVYPGQTWSLRDGGRTFEYRECARCDVMFADPQPTQEEITWLYTHRYDYAWFAKRRHLKRLQAVHRWSRLERQLPENIEKSQKRLLDVGGGHAWFLRAARQAGWQGEGLEILNDELLATARREGITMHHGTLLDHPLAGRQFDLLTMWHVLEHIPDPRAALSAAGSLLAPGGLLVIAVPNRHAAGFRRAQTQWVWCQKPFIHPWHFSASSLRRLLPGELEVQLLTTRDTWDGQYAETTTAYRAAMRVIYLASRVPHRASKALRLPSMEKRSESLQFIGEEALRLAAYGAYTGLRPLFRKSYEEGLKGSELFLIARKK